MRTSSIRVLIVEDFAPFREFLLAKLQNMREVQDVRVVSDGLEAVREAQRLQPHLILLDIGLPTLNGFEAAHKIRTVSPASKIIFVTQESSVDMVQKALNIGASGYVVKTDAGKELLPAVSAVLRGEQFVGKRFAGHNFTAISNLQVADDRNKSSNSANSIPAPSSEIAHHHMADFYSDDEALLEGSTRFIGTALNAGNAVIVIATESHRKGLISKLQAYGIDIATAIDQRKYASFDSLDILSRFMIADLPDPIRLSKVLNDLIDNVSSSAAGVHTRIVACGELAPVLLSQGKPESAIRLEQLWDQLALSKGLDTLCTYSTSSFQGLGSDVFERICALHSSVHSR